MLGKFINLITGLGKIDYAKAKKLAQHKDIDVRLKLAQRNDIVPEVLYFLAEDPSPDVRLAIARNSNAPHKADLLLSRDGNADVRSGIAEKIAKLVPGLSNDELDKVREATHEVVILLARDQATRVRRILSETLKDVANAPTEVIRSLARDVDLMVCAPVLEHSPVLSDNDLLEIIQSNPVKGAISSISARKNISEYITDAIYESDDVDAVSVMLGNASAQIKEDTLDAIIDRAETIEPWHAPLVERPKLSPNAALRLADFVSDNLLTQLEGRADLTPEVAKEVREEFSRRMKAGDEESLVEKNMPADERANILFENNKLDDKAISDACHSGDADFVKKALVLKSGMGFGVVSDIMEMASAKAAVALCWKAGLDIKTAILVQKRIARIPPNEVQGGSGGEYPYSDDEMEWQLDFVRNPK